MHPSTYFSHSPRPSLSSDTPIPFSFRNFDSPAPTTRSLNTASRPDSRSSLGALFRSTSGTPGGQSTSPRKAYSHKTFDSGMFQEWCIYGIDIPVADVCQLQQELDKDIPSDSTGTERDSIGSLSTNTGEIMSFAFGADRWEIELVRSPNARFSPPTSPTQVDKRNNSGLSLYLICRTPAYIEYSGNFFSTKIMVGIREPGEQISQKMSMNGWLWQVWENEWFFTRDREYWGCHTLPPLQELLKNPRIKELDTFVLTVQVQLSMRESVIPRIPEFHSVPVDLFTGVSDLLDDPSTGDVKITVLELYTDENNVENKDKSLSQSTTPTPTPSPFSHRHRLEDKFTIRKRVLYAHSAILKARCEYFATMLSGSWAEGPEKIFDGERTRTIHNVTIEDYDYRTIYWLLKWIYTNEIKFTNNEDVRSKYNNQFPNRILGDYVVGWEWQTIDVLHSCIENSRPSSQLSRSSDNIADGQRIPSRSSYHHNKNIAPAVPTSGIPIHVNSTKSKEQPLQPQRRTNEQLEHPNHHVLSTPGSSTGTSSNSGATTGGIARPSSKLSKALDPHTHPVEELPHASALEIYKLAHKYHLNRLCDIALKHIVSILNPGNALSFLLATHLWSELHEAIKQYAVENYTAVIGDPEFKRCYAEVGEGLWDKGGEVLYEFTTSLVPHLSIS